MDRYSYRNYCRLCNDRVELIIYLGFAFAVVILILLLLGVAILLCCCCPHCFWFPWCSRRLRRVLLTPIARPPREYLTLEPRSPPSEDPPAYSTTCRITNNPMQHLVVLNEIPHESPGNCLATTAEE